MIVCPQWCQPGGYLEQNSVVVPSVLWLGPFIRCYEAKYGEVLRTYFPMVVQSVSNLFVSGALHLIDSVWRAGRVCGCWREFDSALPDCIRRSFRYRHRSIFASEHHNTGI